MQKVNQFVTISRIVSVLLPFAVLGCALAGISYTLPQPQIVLKRMSAPPVGQTQTPFAVREIGENTILNNETSKNANPTIEPTTEAPGGADVEAPAKVPVRCTQVRVKLASSGEIRVMPLEEYVLCAVLGEMPQSFGTEALKAQAVAARTMAVYMAQIETNKHFDCDICTDYRHCQSFLDVSSAAFDVSAARNAVEATRGVVALYGGKPILAAYHASSGKTTNSAASVWGGTLDYLIPVSAPENPNGEKSANGHGVGLSQYGAKALSENGCDYLDILRYYYTGITLGFVDESA